jgi:amidase
MSIHSELLHTTASQLAARLRKKEISSVELTDAHIARIEALDGPINAVVVRDFERARNDARAADEALARGETSRPLLGVPMTVKESYDLTGYPTTWGVEPHREHRAHADALAVQRLKHAGAIVLGKTNVPPVLADWQSDNPIYGRTNNPYDVTRSPGGSSGGSAAALAMRFSALEMGSDIGGSIRAPAAFCGVFGHKPTWGIVPQAGHAIGGTVSAPTPLAVCGPLARSAEDLDIALGVVAGPDVDAPANKLVLPPPRHDKLKSFRVFLMEDHLAASPDAEVRGAMESVADELTRAGATVARTTNLLPDMMASWKTYQSMLHTITTRRSGGDREPISAHTLLDRFDDQFRIRKQWIDFFRHFDVILSPVFSTTAFPHTPEPDWRKRSLMVDGEAMPYGSQLAWASVATVGCLPSTAVPLGLSKEGLPLSLQVIGPHLEDRTTIAFAGMIARETPPPKLAE